MQTDAQSTRSRQTGMSRKSSMSRQSQLVKKATGPTDLRPSDILIERFEAWKNITKNLIAYFEGECGCTVAVVAVLGVKERG